MASKKKATKKAKKVNSKVVAPNNALFVEMSSDTPAVDPAEQEYTWTVRYPEDNHSPTAFVTGLIGGTMVGSLSAVLTLVLVRLFA